MDLQGGSNMTGTDLCVNKPHKSRSYFNQLVNGLLHALATLPPWKRTQYQLNNGCGDPQGWCTNSGRREESPPHWGVNHQFLSCTEHSQSL